MQAILLAEPVRGKRGEDVAAHERVQRRGGLRVETVAGVGLNTFKQAYTKEKLLHLFRLVGEDLFGEVVEDVALALAQDFDEVGRGRRAFGAAARERLSLRDLSDELE